jgi:sterol 3beta-glucosyltransferase
LPSFAERLGVPALLGVVFPQLVLTSAYPAVGFPDVGWPTYNRMTHRAVLTLSGAFARRYTRRWRRANGLPPDRTGYLRHSSGAPIPVLHGFSRHVVPIPPDQPHQVTTTGFWFLDRSDSYAPPDHLRAFLEAGDPPVYVGFGSMAARDPERTTRAVLDAVRQADVRAVLATGWGGLTDADLPAGVLRIRSAPHDWLFPRCAAVVHHGGAGTTAAGLRAGRPTVICPFFGDQPFWGRRAHALGVGPAPIPQRRLTADRLADALAEVTRDPEMRRRAEALGKRIRAENGVERAVEAIEQSVR